MDTNSVENGPGTEGLTADDADPTDILTEGNEGNEVRGS